MSDELAIHELGPLGDGVHQSERGRIFVERALPGDVVQARVHTGAGGLLRGDLIQVTTPSPHRVAAPCPHYEVCGGCSLQHANEAFYRDWKVEIVRRALRREGLEAETWIDPVFLPAGTRRRATFAAVKRNNAVTLGYFRRRSHQVAGISACLILDPAIMALRATLTTALVPILQEGKTADVFIQTVNGRCEIAITGPLGKKGVPDLEVHEGIAELVHSLKITRLSWRTREGNTPEVMVEADPLWAKFGALDVALPPLAFLQPTKAGEDALSEAVMELLPESGKFADLFAGSGTFSGPMLARGPVAAYENLEASVRALDKSKGTKPLTVHRRDLFRNPLYPDEADRFDAIVFDPPRIGAQEQARAMAGAKTPIIVGVSCNPATFARDARILVDGGYHFESIKVVDQFVWSHHVEVVASFTKGL